MRATLIGVTIGRVTITVVATDADSLLMSVTCSVAVYARVPGEDGPV